jgi:hypothetical protein
MFMPGSDVPTVVIVKFIDTVDLTEIVDGPYTYLFSFNNVYEYKAAIQKGKDLFAYPLDYPQNSIEKVLEILSNFSNHQAVPIKLSYAFNQTTPYQILAIKEQARNNSTYTKAKGYSFANFFNYFKVECYSEEQAEKIQRLLHDFVLVDPVNYFSCPLNCVYIRVPSVLASRLTCEVAERQSQDFWLTLNILPFWKRQDEVVKNVLKIDPDERVWIHEIEDSWGRHSDLSETIAFPSSSGNRVEYADMHGCAVLGILSAKWHNNVRPTEIIEYDTNGIAPMVPVKLYPRIPNSSSRRVHYNNDYWFFEDDSLAQAMYAARNRPGDIILLEKALPTMPKYNNGKPMNNIGRRDASFPLELDQLIYDLIKVAAHETGLKLIVVEPAGNSSFNLDTLQIYLERNATNLVIAPNWEKALPEVNKRTIDFLKNYTPAPSFRYMLYDQQKDSGAIMVGGAVHVEGGWQYAEGTKSNYGNRVDVYAPCDGIRTTYPEDGFGVICETSAAAALVAGMIAALQTIYKYNNSNQTVLTQTLRSILRNNYLPVDQKGIPSLDDLGEIIF